MEQSIQPEMITPPPESGRFSQFYARHSRLMWGSLITVAVAVASLLTYALFFRGGSITSDPEYTGDIVVAITAPEESVSGSDISYEISLENQGSSAVGEIALEVFYPQGFTFTDSTPDSDTDGRRFSIPDLSRGAKSKVIIIGRLEGNVQEIKSVTARVHYVPENFRSSFVAQGSAQTVMLAPDIIVEIASPAHLVSGQTITYEVSVTNISTEEFQNLSLEMTYPPKFSPITSGSSFDIPRLGIGETETIAISGRLAENPGEDSFVTAELFLESGGERLSAGRSYAFTRILPSPLALSQSVRGGQETVAGGEILEYEITYQNIGNIGLHNVTITVALDGPAFDTASVSSVSGQFKASQVIWTPAALAELRVVDPGEQGKVDFRVKILDDSRITQKNPQAATRIFFVADEITEVISGNSLAMPMTTRLALGSGVTVVSGPADPAVGQTTVYEVALTVSNSVNDAEGAVLTAILPRVDSSFAADSFAPPAEIGNAKYNASAGTITWTLGRVFAFSGSVHEPRVLRFRMSLTPQSQSFNYILVKDAELAARDEFTGEQISSNKIREIRAD